MNEISLGDRIIGGEKANLDSFGGWSGGGGEITTNLPRVY